MKQRNRVLGVCSTLALIVMGFYEFLLASPPPRFLEQGPEVFLPLGDVSTDRALSDAGQQARNTVKRVEPSATTLQTKKAV